MKVSSLVLVILSFVFISSIQAAGDSVKEMESRIKVKAHAYSIMDDEALYAELQKEMDYFNKQTPEAYLPGLSYQSNVVETRKLIANPVEMRHVWGNCTNINYYNYNEFPENRERYLSSFLKNEHKASMSLILAEFYVRRYRYSSIYEQDILPFKKMVDNFISIAPLELSDFEKMMEKIEQNSKLSINVERTVRDHPELFTDENIIKLINKASDVLDKDEETVFMEMANSLILARDKTDIPVEEWVKKRYQDEKELYLDSGMKDYNIFRNRLIACFKTNELSTVIEVLIDQDGKLMTKEQMDVFTGTSFRKYKDGLFNQTSYDKHVNDAHNFLLLNLLIIGANKSVIIGDDMVPTERHLFQHGSDSYFAKLETFYGEFAERHIKNGTLVDIRKNNKEGIIQKQIREDLFPKIKEQMKVVIEKARMKSLDVR